MKLLIQLLVLTAILSPKTSFAGNQKFWTADSAKLYITAMKYFDSYDRGFFGAPKPGSAHASLNFLYPESFAADGVHCLLAGYAGTINTTTKHCETDSDVYAADLATCKGQDSGSFPCSRDIFSTTANPLICAKTSGNRWTASCAATFFAKAGLSSDTLDKFSDADYPTLAAELIRMMWPQKSHSFVKWWQRVIARSITKTVKNFKLNSRTRRSRHRRHHR